MKMLIKLAILTVVILLPIIFIYIYKTNSNNIYRPKYPPIQERTQESLENNKDLYEFLENIEANDLAGMYWDKREYQNKDVLIVRLSNDDKEVVFLYDPSDYMIASNCEDIHTDQTSNIYGFYLRPSAISSKPLHYSQYYYSDLSCIEKSCSENINIENNCVCKTIIENLNEQITSRFDSVINGNLSWVTDDILNEFKLAREDYKTMSSTCNSQHIKIATYDNNRGILKIAMDTDDNILGIITFAPILY